MAEEHKEHKEQVEAENGEGEARDGFELVWLSMLAYHKGFQAMCRDMMEVIKRVKRGEKSCNTGKDGGE